MRPASAYRVILRSRPFAALWIGQALSQFGDALYDLALLWYVFDTTGSGFATASIAVASGGGRLLGGLLGGVILDRLPVRRVMLAVEVVRCALAALVGVGWVVGLAPPLALLYALAFSLACGGALFVPARLVAIPRLVPRDVLVTANALDLLARSLVSTLAWGASGAIVARIGHARGLLIDAATFLVSLVAIAWARWPDEPSVARRAEGLGVGLLRGARWLRADRLGRAVLLAQLAQSFAGGLFFAGIVPHLQRNLGGGAISYGIQGAVYGAALMAGSWLIGRLAVRRIGLLYAVGFVVNGIGNSGFALAPVFGALLPAVAVSGLGAAAFIAGEATLLQTQVPPAVRGRVIALTILLATATGMIGLALGGWLVDHWRIRPVLLLGALAHVAIGCALWRVRAVRAARGDAPEARWAE